MTSSTEHRRFAPLAGGTSEPHEERVSARAVGYAEGWASGNQAAALRAQEQADRLQHAQEAAAARAQAEVDQAVASLRRAAGQLTATTAPLLDDVATVVLEAAIMLASAVLDAELVNMDDVASAAVRRALAPLATDVPVTVRVHPEDHAVLVQLLGDATGRFEAHEVTLVPDATLRRGDAMSEQAGALVDARVEAALERAVAAVRGQGWQQ
ncbi:FliH/SctL family protein [Angustibacter aerolatus]